MRAARRIGPAGRIISGLAEHPGAEDRTERGPAVVDRSVRVMLKVLVEALFEFEGSDGGVHRGECGDDRGGGRAYGPCSTSAGWRS